MSKPSFNIRQNCYAPYSGEPETCYVQGGSGLCYPGVRIENVSFPLTIAAIHGAICSCLANGDQPEHLYKGDPNSVVNNFWIEEFNLEMSVELPESLRIYDPLAREIENINNCLTELCDLAVVAESGFPVSAILVTSGGFIPGVNIEFSEWNLGLCAERVAIARAFSAGYTDFLGMHIYAPKSDYISPCGACRQVLYEHMPNQLIELHHDNESVSKHFVSHLLPNGFSTNSLKQ